MSGSSSTPLPRGSTFTRVGAGVVKLQRTSSASDFPLIAFVPAGILTVYLVAIGRRFAG